jgi:alcohol dehydrogenase
MESFDFQPRTRLLFGVGAFLHLGERARELGFSRTLIVADAGIAACGYVDEAARQLAQAGIASFHFQGFDENPDTAMIEAGRACAAAHEIDSLIGLGGGSSMDTAKGINFVLTNGRAMRDYWGYDKAAQPLLPMIGVPTTAGTGSEAQSYALISDAATHAKMACGAPSAAFRTAILDPRLTVSQPAQLTATTGFDAIAHAVETFVTTKRNPLSLTFSREAWRLLANNYERVLNEPDDLEARGAMLLGSYFAGMAIENSMLGATHACANPLTAHYNMPHGVAISIILPQVVRWNGAVIDAQYRELLHSAGLASTEQRASETLAQRLEQLAMAGALPGTLSEINVPQTDLPSLAEEAAQQWTGTFNPRAWSAAGALEVYEWAY